jgi:glycerol-3-phosphate dehydrogenase
MPRNAFITTFAGIRAHLASHDFVLGEPEDAPCFFNAAGIESPGLTSAPAIAKELAAQIADRLGAKPKDDYRPGRPKVVRFRELDNAARAALIASDPAYGRIVCRCETVTEAEVRASIRRPVGARSIDAVKRRTRAGMGRCQGGFCMPRVLDILAEELGVSPLEITKCGGKSFILVDRLHGESFQGMEGTL